MKKLVLLALCLTTYAGIAQTPQDVSNQPTLIKNQNNLSQETIKGMVLRVQEQVTQLAKAFDEKQYDWRPAEGVRSVRESLLHIAVANYFLASKLGHPAPENVDFMTMEQKITGKENVLAALKASNEFILEVISKEPTQTLAEEVDFGFAKFNRLAGLLVILEHAGEHKGQLIAYARSNGVTPPWSLQ